MDVKKFPNKLTCKVCKKSKIHVQPFPKKSKNKSDSVLSVIHSCVCGRSTIATNIRRDEVFPSISISRVRNGSKNKNFA